MWPSSQTVVTIGKCKCEEGGQSTYWYTGSGCARRHTSLAFGGHIEKRQIFSSNKYSLGVFGICVLGLVTLLQDDRHGQVITRRMAER